MVTQYPKNDRVNMHLVESCGCIYLVRMYSYGGGPTNCIDIYCLNAYTDEWLRVDSIGDRAFFLSDMSYVSVCTPYIGVESNCIYYVPFCSEDERKIYKFCLDDHTMAFNIIPTEKTAYESRFCWFVPTRLQRKDSSALPAKVLNEASEDKGFNDNLTSSSIQKAKTWPWLMYQEKLDGKCKLLDPLNGIEYSTRIRLPSSVLPAQILCSKDGWVILLDAANALFMVNPLIGEVVKLPSIDELDEGFSGITFTSVPTSDCLVLGYCTNRRDESIKIYKWLSGDKDWTIVYGDGALFCAANTNPVVFQGELYCLGETGELRVFNPVEETWRMLDKPEPVYSEDEAPFQGTQDCYLLELGGDLVSVFKYNYFDYNVRIFMLDRWRMEWVPVNDLAGWTLFLDARCSFAKSSPLERWSNKIFFSAIHSSTTKTCATYCIKSKRYDQDRLSCFATSKSVS
ncbi:hypothetical protein LUZ61_009302 [Rhynchospora tenuis]|uniref:KIB1-4 beta-propeller domain-containing protein n=1 Tax=Rhynchospora tenuis TaxID=198213 RepID=A0AAD6EY73_9POAL|nr:hypothetical protein LUZ61_009302 [Rhynchospora tenuis]